MPVFTKPTHARIRRSRTRRATTLTTVVALAAALGALGTSSASALPGGNFFELDGNAVDSAPATNPPYDWSTLQSACTVVTCTAPVVANTGIIDDRPSAQGGTDMTFFQGGGSKDDLDITSWGTGGAGAPDKNELTNAYAVATRDASQNLVVVFGADRFDNSGAANMGFWLLRNEIDEGMGANAGKFVNKGTSTLATHSVGDILVLSDFTNGGQLGAILIYQWVGAGNGNAGSNNVLQLVGSAAQSPTKSNPDPLNPADCTYTGSNPAPNNSTFCATINKTPTSSPWAYESKDAATPPVVGDPNAFPARSFIEGAVNVGSLTGGQCFASFLAETRTAPEIQGAQLKDYALGSFAVCQPSTTMLTTPATAVPAVVHSNENTVLSFYEKNDGNVVLNNVGVTTDNTGCTPTRVTGAAGGDGTNPGVFDPGETWKFTCTMSFTTGGVYTITATGTGTDAQGNVITYPGDAQERTSVTVTVVNPGTQLREAVSAVVTFTYYEKNTGDTRINAVSVTSTCAGAGTATPTMGTPNANTQVAEENFNIGNTNYDTWLDPGETWQFTCQKTMNLPFGTASTTFDDDAEGHGTDSLGTTVPSSGETDSSSVTLTNDSPNTTP
jgi:hypothetical protein